MKLRMPRLLFAAGLLLALYGVSWVLGLEDWVGLLSGTPVPGVPLEVAAMGAMFHVLSWFGVVLVAPILVIAAGLLEAASAVGHGAEPQRSKSSPRSNATASKGLAETGSASVSVPTRR